MISIPPPLASRAVLSIGPGCSLGDVGSVVRRLVATRSSVLTTHLTPIEFSVVFRFDTDAKKLKTFCGMVSYYRRFIPNCSKIASPLYKLLKKDARFEWNEPQENVFQLLKPKLVSRPILQYPDFSIEFILTTDVSN